MISFLQILRFLKFSVLNFWKVMQTTALTDPQSIVIDGKPGTYIIWISGIIRQSDGCFSRKAARPGFQQSSVIFRRTAISVFQLFVHCRSGLYRKLAECFIVYLFIIESTLHHCESLRRQLPAFVDATIKKEMHAAQYQLELQP